MRYFDEGRLRQLFFIVIILLLALILFWQLKAFLPATLGAFTLYVLLNKWMRKLVALKWPPALAAATLMFFSFAIIVLPIGSVIKMLISRLSISEDQFREAVNAIQVFTERIEKKTGIELLTDEHIGQLSSLLAGKLPSILGATFNTITTLMVLYFILYFMLTQGKQMEDGFSRLLPMQKNHRQLLQKETNSLVMSNAIGIPLIALLQGVVGLIGYLILGVKEPFLWFSVTCITAMLPIVGAALAYIPLAIMFFVGGDTWRGVAMLVLGFGIIGTVDNIFRFWLQKKIGDVHPLVTVFGVLVGLQLFGFIGLVFGPLLISLFMLLIHIYRIEFTGNPETANLQPQTSGDKNALDSEEG